jgi:hypothetical protein
MNTDMKNMKPEKTDIPEKNTRTTAKTDNHLIFSSSDTNSVTTDNPHLPVAYTIEQNETSPDEDSYIANTELEEGQNRTFIYSATPFENDARDEDENSTDGYFLAPGQSRTFLAEPEENDYPPEEQE